MPKLRVFAFFACAASVFGAATTITDNVSSIGSVTHDTITAVSVTVPSGFTAADSTVVSAGTTPVSLSSNGAFSVSLYPNANTSGIYTFTYTGVRRTYTENLSVPISGSAIALTGARVFGAILTASKGESYMMPSTFAAATSSGISVYSGAGSPAGISCTVDSYTSYQGTIYRCPSGTLVWTAITGGGGSLPSVTNLLKGDGSGNALDAGIAATSVVLTNQADIVTTSGAASAPAIDLNGTWFTGGTNTTTKPYVLIEPSGATSTGWSTSGTGLGVNAAGGYTGNLLDLQTGGSSRFKVNSAGALVNATTISALSGASSPSLLLNGTDYTGGTGTTTWPEFLIQPTGTTSTVWNTSGTMMGVNAASAFAGNLLDLQANGTSEAKIDASGNLTTLGYQLTSAAGAASTPAESLTGAWFTGGTGTTTKPQLLIEPTGTTSTGWSTSGTALGVNSGSAFTGNLMDLELNGSSKFRVNYAGTIVNSGGLQASGTGSFTGTAGASSPSFLINGSPYTGGTGTTTWPQFLVQPNGTTSTTWSTSGAMIGVNSASGFGGNLIDLQANGTDEFRVNSTGSVFHSGALTTNGVHTVSGNAAASSPSLLVAGTAFTGGTGTTTWPQLLVQPTGTTSTVWNTSGTMIGTNAVSGFAGNLLDLQVNGTDYFRVAASGVIVSNGVADINGNPGASNPSLAIQGTTYTGGTGTTTWPQLLVQPTGTTSTNWNTNGTMMGVNAASGFGGNLIDLQANGTDEFRVNSTGSIFHSGALTTNGAHTISGNAGASAPSLLVNGTVYTAGTGSTNWPQLLVQPTGTTATGWSVAGTLIGANGVSGFAGNLLDLQTNGTDKFYVNAGGTMDAYNGVFYGTTGASTASVIATGVPYTAGTSSTNWPVILAQPSGTTSAAWSTSGTMIGTNAPSAFAGNLMDLQLNGTSEFNVTSTGVINGALGSTGVLGNFGLSTVNAVEYFTINGGRGLIGFDGVNNATFIQGATSKGIEFAANNSTAGSGIVGTFSSGGVFGIGSNAAATSDPFQVTSGGVVSTSAAGAASKPAQTLNGAWFTGGTGTTTKPQLLIEPTGTTSTGWSTSGTGLGVNSGSAFTGNLMDLQSNGTSEFSVSSTGYINSPDHCTLTKYTIPYNDAALTGVSSATPTKTLFSLASTSQRVCMIEISGTTSFTGITNLTAATVRLQSSAGTPLLYSPNQDIFGTVGPTTNNFWADAGDTADRSASGVVAAFTFTCSSGTCYSSGLTGGSVNITVGVRTVL